MKMKILIFAVLVSFMTVPAFADETDSVGGDNPAQVSQEQPPDNVLARKDGCNSPAYGAVKVASGLVQGVGLLLQVILPGSGGGFIAAGAAQMGAAATSKVADVACNK